MSRLFTSSLCVLLVVLLGGGPLLVGSGGSHLHGVNIAAASSHHADDHGHTSHHDNSHDGTISSEEKLEADGFFVGSADVGHQPYCCGHPDHSTTTFHFIAVATSREHSLAKSIVPSFIASLPLGDGHSLVFDRRVHVSPNRLLISLTNHIRWVVLQV